MHINGISNTHFGIYKIRRTIFMFELFNLHTHNRFQSQIDQAVENIIRVFYLKDQYLLKSDVMEGKILLTTHLLLKQLMKNIKEN